MSFPFRLYVNDGSDAVVSLRASDTTFPSGSSLTLQLGLDAAVTFLASLSASTATWTMAAIELAEVEHLAPAEIVYTPPVGDAVVVGEGTLLRNWNRTRLSVTAFALLPYSEDEAPTPQTGLATEESLVNLVNVSVRAVEDAVTALSVQTREDADLTRIDLGALLEAIEAVEAAVVAGGGSGGGSGGGGGAADPALVAAVDAVTAAIYAAQTAATSERAGAADDIVAALTAVANAVQGVIAEVSAADTAARDGVTVLAALLGDLRDLLGADQTVALSPATLAALENVTASVSGSVSVSNLPATYPLPAEQIATLTPPTPVVGLTDTELRAEPVPVSGDIQVSGDVAVSNFPAEYPLPASQIAALSATTNGLTDAELRAAPVPVEAEVTGAVAVTNQPTSFPLPADQVAALAPQVDGLTDTELRAAPLEVTGSVAVTNQPDTYPLPGAQVAALAPQTDALTAAELRAAPVDVVGNVAVSNHPSTYPLPVAQIGALTPQVDALTDLELRAAPLEVEATVTGAVSVTNQPSQYPLPAGQVTTLTPQTDALTSAQLRASPLDVADSGEREYTPVVASVTAVGNTTVYTPAAGKRLVLRWIYAIADPSSGLTPLIKVFLGAEEKYRVYALSKRQKITGPVNGALVINLSSAAPVAVTALLEEV